MHHKHTSPPRGQKPTRKSQEDFPNTVKRVNHKQYGFLEFCLFLYFQVKFDWDMGSLTIDLIPPN